MENEVKEAAPKYNYISPEQYLERERASTEKHEYYKGEMFAMAGASKQHNIIVKNLNTVILPFLKEKNCDMFGSDLRIHVPENSLFSYPDFSIICGEWETTDEENDTVKNPSVIIEVLSKSTRDYDRGTKFTLYRSIKSLKEYILVDSLSVSVEIYTRQPDNGWLLKEFQQLSNTFYITSIGLTISLKNIYEGASFDE
jgi:Uma2 family endonuclease